MAFIPGVPPLRNTPSKSITPLSTRPTGISQPGNMSEMKVSERPNQEVRNQSKRGKKSRVRGKDKPKDKVYIPIDLSGDSSSSSDSESFSKPVNRSIFYDDDRHSPVPFVENIPNLTVVQELEPLINNEDNIQSCKVMWNLSSFYKTTLVSGKYVDDQYASIFQRLSREVMSEIRSSSLVSAWNLPQFFEAIMAVVNALEIFYTLDSVFSYRSSDRQDKNSGVLLLQSAFESSEVLVGKDRLRRALKGCWCPPQMSNLIRWTFQWYKTDDLDQATNYRFLPNDAYMSYDSASLIEPLIEAAITALQDIDNIKIYSIMSAIRPEGRIVGLPKSCSYAVYDKRHYEIYSNQPVIYDLNGTIQTYPHAGSFPNGYIPYGLNSNCDDASGLGFVMQTIYAGAGVSLDPIIDFFRPNHSGPTIGYDSNKWYMIPHATYLFDTKSRSQPGTNSNRQNSDVHNLEVTGGSISYVQSSVKPGFQPVFFDTSRAPLINLRMFMDSLFGL